MRTLTHAATRTALGAAIVLLLAAGAAAKDIVSCQFSPDGWDSNRWTLVKSPRWDHFGGWVQREDCIENETPPDTSPADLENKRYAETYTSMVLKDKVSGAVTIRATLSYAHRMAPLIVLAPELGQDAQGRPEFREHWEIVLFHEGVNVWHHVPRDGKPWWKKAAHVRFPTKPDAKYALEVRIARGAKGTTLTVFVDGEEKMGYMDDSLPDALHVGITGCEGVNRFYDLRVETK